MGGGNALDDAGRVERDAVPADATGEAGGVNGETPVDTVPSPTSRPPSPTRLQIDVSDDGHATLQCVALVDGADAVANASSAIVLAEEPALGADAPSAVANGDTRAIIVAEPASLVMPAPAPGSADSMTALAAPPAVTAAVPSPTSRPPSPMRLQIDVSDDGHAMLQCVPLEGAETEEGEASVVAPAPASDTTAALGQEVSARITPVAVHKTPARDVAAPNAATPSAAAIPSPASRLPSPATRLQIDISRDGYAALQCVTLEGAEGDANEPSAGMTDAPAEEACFTVPGCAPIGPISSTRTALATPSAVAATVAIPAKPPSLTRLQISVSDQGRAAVQCVSNEAASFETAPIPRPTPEAAAPSTIKATTAPTLAPALELAVTTIITNAPRAPPRAAASPLAAAPAPAATRTVTSLAPPTVQPSLLPPSAPPSAAALLTVLPPPAASPASSTSGALLSEAPPRSASSPAGALPNAGALPQLPNAAAADAAALGQPPNAGPERSTRMPAVEGVRILSQLPPLSPPGAVSDPWQASFGREKAVRSPPPAAPSHRQRLLQAESQLQSLAEGGGTTARMMTARLQPAFVRPPATSCAPSQGLHFSPGVPPSQPSAHQQITSPDATPEDALPMSGRGLAWRWLPGKAAAIEVDRARKAEAEALKIGKAQVVRAKQERVELMRVARARQRVAQGALQQVRTMLQADSQLNDSPGGLQLAQQGFHQLLSPNVRSSRSLPTLDRWNLDHDAEQRARTASQGPRGATPYQRSLDEAHAEYFAPLHQLPLARSTLGASSILVRRQPL